MKKLKIVGLIFLPIVFYLIIVILLGGNHKLILPIISTFFFVLGFFSRNLDRIFLLSIPFLVITSSNFFLENPLTGIIILYLITAPVSIFLGYKTSNVSKYLVFLFIIFTTSIYFGIENWMSLINNSSARTNQRAAKIELYTEDDTLIELDDGVKGKVVVLDFWTTSCGVCFKKFPDFEEVYLKFINNPKVEIYSVNIPVKRDTLEKTKKLVKRLNYKFPTLYAKSNEIPEKYGFNTFPHLIILKSGNIRYNGQLVVGKKVKFYNLVQEIERLLEE